VTSHDAELSRLLLLEISRHLPALEQSPPDPTEARRALHALKGSLGLAGEQALAAEITRLERSVNEGDDSAVRTAAGLLRHAQEKLLAGESASEGLTAWPEPPPTLAPRPIDPSLRPQYAAEVTDRLAGIDEALGGSMTPIEAVAVAFRQVHTIKGAASAVGDEPMAWFCHGLEGRLKSGSQSRDAASSALAELARWRGVLGGLLEDPHSALLSLRAARHFRSAPPSAHPSQMPDDEPRSIAGDDATIRVAALSVDRLLERTTTVSVAREAIAQSAIAVRSKSARLRALRADLAEALRLIGPPRPWGAPAAALSRIRTVADALVQTSEQLEETAAAVRLPEQALRESASANKRELSAMRQTPLRRLFARLTVAIEAEARRSGREIAVHESGGDETVDRRLAEQLLDPLLHVARNAVAHGIEPVAVREGLGKPRCGTIGFAAVKSAGRLRVTITDDGAGVDVAEVRRRAVEAGMLTATLADHADDDMLLGLLFVPGFTTRDASDLLAGRGIGLDIALAAVQRLGGRMHLVNRAGEGITVVVEVPVESGFSTVLWVDAGGDTYAMLASDIAAVRRNDGPVPAPHLTACIEGDAPELGAPVCLELAVEGERAAVAVEAVGALEELLVRPLTPLVAAMGPFAGAIVRGDGTVRLALDAHALAPRARALGRVAAGIPSDRPRPS